MSSPVTERERAIVRALQNDLPLVPEPYAALAEEMQISEEELMAGIQSLMDKGCLKRISIALRHKNVGFTINVMVVWDVPDDQVDAIGKEVAAHPAVTHCYRRNRDPRFPYNLYTMVHARTDEEYDQIIQELLGIIGKDTPHDVSFDALRSMRELKKIGMKYFIEDPEDVIEDED
ncbi:Lrp/AsnC family transcriptional regulator [Peptococcus simiae]|uniref:siroheme decarboxylase n=1 Tax=Peptococcus simiae TaxID=1643805 RepID=A0ABW9GXR3_9FIRM